MKKKIKKIYQRGLKEFNKLETKHKVILFITLGFLLSYGIRSLRRAEIEVVGTHFVQEYNTVATFIISLKEEGSDKNSVQETVNKQGEELKNTLLEFGLKEDSFKTINNYIFESSQNQNTRFQDPNIKFWEGGVSVEVKLDNINKASELASNLALLETIQIYGPTYSADLDKIDDASILSEAVKDAKRKAVKVAGSQGKSVIRILSIEELSTLDSGVYGEVLGYGGQQDSSGYLPGTTKITKSAKVRFVIR